MYREVRGGNQCARPQACAVHGVVVPFAVSRRGMAGCGGISGATRKARVRGGGSKDGGGEGGGSESGGSEGGGGEGEGSEGGGGEGGGGEGDTYSTRDRPIAIGWRPVRAAN